MKISHTKYTPTKRRYNYIVVQDYKRCFLIDIAVPTDNKQSVKEFNGTYKSLEIEIEKTCYLKTPTDKYVYKRPGNTSLFEIRNIALNGTAFSLREYYTLN